MAKQIPNAKEKIYSISKKYLFEKGYKGLTLRQVAAQCDIAVGTIYNYFPSKDILVASIMAEDWLVSLNAMQNACVTAPTVEQGVRAIYDAIREYANKYEPIWTEYKGMPNGFGQRHIMLRSQLSNLLVELLERFGYEDDTEPVPLLAETVLACAMQKDIPYSMLAEMTGRLYP